MLVLGDSLALGVGASCPEKTPWGQIACDYPNCEIHVQAVSGARVRDLQDQLAKSPPLVFDIVLLCVGANDIIRISSSTQAANAIEKCLVHLSHRARHCVVISSANVGGAPIFWPLNSLYSRRSLSLTQKIEAIAKQQGAQFVNTCFAPDADIFARSPRRYFNEDQVHPSDEAYAVVYEMTRQRVRFDQLLSRASPVYQPPVVCPPMTCKTIPVMYEESASEAR